MSACHTLYNIYAEIGGTGRQVDLMNIIKYKAAGKIHVKDTELSFYDLSDEIVARKVYVIIQDDSRAKLSSGEIRTTPSPNEREKMSKEEINDYPYITDIEFIDYRAKKILTMKLMSDYINHNYKVSILI